MSAAIEVCERGDRLAFSFAELLRFSGPGSPGGVALAFKALERALPLLDPGAPCERREIEITTPFGGPGARDGFEAVTRCVSDGRYVVDPSLARPERGRALERFAFTLGYRGRSLTLTLREGFVSEEFVDLAGAEARTEAQQARLDELKRELADRLLERPAGEVFDLVG